MLKRRTVWNPKHHDDGLRLLVTRFRGRGMPASRYDVWMPSLGPSEKLLKAYQGGRISWATFALNYRRELFEDGAVDRRNTVIKNHGQKFTLRLLKRLARRSTVTIMCHCPDDEPHCHTRLLKALLQSTRI